MLIIKNANLLSMKDENELKTDIMIKDGKIFKIDNVNENEYSDATIIDAKGKLVTPGLVDGHCHVGMCEDGIRIEGGDINEMSSPVTPQMRGIDSIKPQDPAFKEALRSGITTVVTGPGSAEVIAGTFCALKTHGKSVLDMCIKEEATMKMALGENPKRVFSSKDQCPQTRMGSAALIRENLIKAKKYYEKKQKYLSEIKNVDAKVIEPEFNMMMESLSRVYDGLKVKIHAHQQDDIVTAIRIAEEFNLDYSIEHCTEGYLIPEILKEHNVPIIIGPTLGTRTKYELRNKSFDAGKVLIDNDIKFAIMTDHPVIPLENTLTQAAIYIKHGMTSYQVLKALTINPAEICGISDRVGSIEIGKDADIVIWSNDPFHYLSKAEVVIVNGEVVVNQ
ncbi:MAG: amidohydrolase [Anaerorhabdus sp.]